MAVSGPVEIGSGAAVEGDVSAASLDISGRLLGDAKCAGTIQVRSGAEVKGDLTGSSVAIEAGSRVDVQLDTEFTLDFEGRR